MRNGEWPRLQGTGEQLFDGKAFLRKGWQAQQPKENAVTHNRRSREIVLSQADDTKETQGALRSWLLVTVAAAVLGASGAALAQNAQQGQQDQQAQQGQQQQAGATQQVQQAEQALRQATQQMSGQQPDLQAARQAVSQAEQALGQVPGSMRNEQAYRNAQQQLTEARDVLQGQQPEPQRVRTQVDEAAQSLAALRGEMGGVADTAAAAGGAAAGARIAVQQPAPQVTVQQPEPQVTVQQPQPQVTVRQPEPQVTVQQPQPQVTVQQPEPRVTVQQAQPRVQVQETGQPQVQVQETGQPQVQVQQSGQPQADVERGTGATAQPHPAQSDSAVEQTAATATRAGVPLGSVQALVGTNVVGADGQETGEVENLLMDNSGQVRAAVVQWGGFLGIGERRAVVPIDRIQLGAAGDRARLNMTRQELEQQPRFDRSQVAAYGRDHGWGEGVRLFR